jgi:hypothetical protein
VGTASSSCNHGPKDVEATPARTYGEVAATHTTIERTRRRFDLSPKRLAADHAIRYSSTSLNTTNVILRDLKMTNVYNQAVRAMGAVRGFVLENSRIEIPRSSALPLVELQGTTGSAIRDNSLITLGNDALAVGTTAGPSNVTAQLRIIDNTIGGVRDTRAGIRLKNVNSAVVRHNVIAPAVSTTKAVGISLAVNPDGTTNSIVTNNNVTAMTNTPPIICAVGQGNVVSHNAGAPDCAR